MTPAENQHGITEREAMQFYYDLWRRLFMLTAELEGLAVELARWSKVGERNGDLHARLASVLARLEEFRGQRDALGKDTA